MVQAPLLFGRGLRLAGCRHWGPGAEPPLLFGGASAPQAFGFKYASVAAALAKFEILQSSRLVPPMFPIGNIGGTKVVPGGAASAGF